MKGEGNPVVDVEKDVKAIEIKIESEKTDEVVETSSRRAAPIVTKTENEEGAARRTTAPRNFNTIDNSGKT